MYLLSISLKKVKNLHKNYGTPSLLSNYQNPAHILCFLAHYYKVSKLLLKARHSKCVRTGSCIVLSARGQQSPLSPISLIFHSLLNHSHQHSHKIVLHFKNNLSFTIIFAPFCCKIPIPFFYSFLILLQSDRSSSFPFYRNYSCQSNQELPCGQTHFRSHCPFLWHLTLLMILPSLMLPLASSIPAFFAFLLYCRLSLLKIHFWYFTF